MYYHVRRTQWAVGQGFMHTGVLNFSGGARADRVWMYDCGGSSSALVGRELEQLRERHESKIDLLYLSHLHSDHVNGLQNLRERGFSVGTVFIPLLEIWERLWAFGSWSEANPPDWFAALIVDPAEWLGEWTESVVFVTPGANGILPGEFERPKDSSDEVIQSSLQPPSRDKAGTLTALEARTAAVDRFGPVWVWEPYVLRVVQAQRNAFRDEFVRRLKADPLTLQTTDLIQLLGDKIAIKELRAIYKALLKQAHQKQDLNITSMCLYAGPAAEPNGRWRSRWPESKVDVEARPDWRDRPEVGCWNQPPGWLVTGDGTLREDDRVKEILEYYHHRYSLVGMLGLPHHGSIHNYNSKLVEGLESEAHTIVGAASKSRYSHPHHDVLVDVQGHGHHLIIVSESADSRFSDVLAVRA